MMAHKFVTCFALSVLAFILSGCPPIEPSSSNNPTSTTVPTVQTVVATSTPVTQAPIQEVTVTTTQASTATSVPLATEVASDNLHIVSPGFQKNTYLIQGMNISHHHVGDSLVVYGEIAHTEIAIGLLKVIQINPDSISAQAILVHPNLQIFPNLRVDDKLDYISNSELIPAEDHAVGYLLSPGRIRLRPNSGVQENSVLEGLDLVISGNTILDALPFTPTIEMNVIRVGTNDAVASVALAAGSNWPITGTIVNIVEKPSPTSTVAPLPTETPIPTKQASSLVPLEPDGIQASRWSGASSPNYAFDGKTDTLWDLDSEAVGGWFIARFRDPQTVSRIGIYHGPVSDLAQIREATLTFSDDSQQTIKLAGFNEWDYVDFEPVTTTSIKLEITAVYPSGNRAWVYEVKFFGSKQAVQQETATPTAHLTEIKADGIEASRWSGAAGPEQGFDGKTDTVWDLYDQAVGGWFVARFRNPQTISRIGIYHGPVSDLAQIREAILTFSDDSQQTIKLAGFNEWDYVDFEPVTTTSIKLEITAVYPSGNRAWVYEVKFFGSE